MIELIKLFWQARRLPDTLCIRTCITSPSGQLTELSAPGQPWKRSTERTGVWWCYPDLTKGSYSSTIIQNGRCDVLKILYRYFLDFFIGYDLHFCEWPWGLYKSGALKNGSSNGWGWSLEINGIPSIFNSCPHRLSLFIHRHLFHTQVISSYKYIYNKLPHSWSDTPHFDGLCFLF